MPLILGSQESRKRPPTVVIAMAGLGKSTFCKTHIGVEDDDFGNWCKAKGLTALDFGSAERRAQAKAFVQGVIIPDLRMGQLVLTNEPDIWRYLPPEVAVLTVVPNSLFTPQWFADVVRRTVVNDPQELSDPDSFLKRYLRDGLKWPSGDNWRIAGIPCFEVGSHEQFETLLEALL